MAMTTTMTIDRKTGRKRMKSMKAVRAGRKGARAPSRRGPKSMSEKMDIRRGVMKVLRTGRTASGRRAHI